jgi:glutamate N-acetyltransferase / amino-acid N-acetyltransferase
VAVTAAHWPPGFSSAGIACGIKSEGALDLGLLVADRPVVWAGTFTRNAAAAPCVHWNRRALGADARAVVVNSGNANACTGKTGLDSVALSAGAVAEIVGCEATQVLVASTGPIGVPLEVDRLIGALPAAARSLTPDAEEFAAAILTTDTATKSAAAEAGDARVVGVAKGAAMIAPNMATLLGFICTDAALGHQELQTMLSRSIGSTFNRICVDACESTNDMVLCLATGQVAIDGSAFARALEEVCGSLAHQIAADAEGATRLVRIIVTGAADDATAAGLGRAVAASALWRAAIHGADPNWGRVVAALGAADRDLDLARLSIAVGGEPLFAAGEPVGSIENAREALGSDDVLVTCEVGGGRGAAQVLSSDLSPEYVTLNAFVTT